MNRIVTRLQPGQSGVQYLAGIQNISLLQRPTLTLKPTQLPIQYVPGAVSQGIKQPGEEADCSTLSSGNAQASTRILMYMHE